MGKIKPKQEKRGNIALAVELLYSLGQASNFSFNHFGLQCMLLMGAPFNIQEGHGSFLKFLKIHPPDE